MKAVERKSRKKSLNVIIPLVIYPFDVMFSFGESDEQLKKTLRKYNVDWDEAFKLNGVGRCVMTENNQSVVRLDQIPITCADYGTLSHEIFHAIDFILRRAGMMLTEESGEAYAYLIGYLTKGIYKQF